MTNLYRLFVFIFLVDLGFLPSLAQQPAVSCQTPSVPMTPELLRIMERVGHSVQAGSRQKAKPMLECLIAIDVASDVYTLFNQDTNEVRERVYYTLKQVSKVFEEETQIKLTISTINIWKQPSPYESISDENSYLAAMSNWWRTNRKTVPHQLVLNYSTKRNGLANINTGSLAYGAVVGVDLSGDFRIMTTAHELGHNFGSFHTHECPWPGGPIDRCSAVGGSACNHTETQDEIGTIMSYCGLSTLTFHPLCRELMRQNAEASGLEMFDSAPATPVPTVTDRINIRLHDNLDWHFVRKAQQYRLQLATDPAFTAIQTDTLVSVAHYRAVSLIGETYYYWRVKAINPAGESDWSTVSRLKVNRPTTGYTPLPRYPALGAVNVSEFRFEWYPQVSGVEYRVQLSPSSEFPPLSTTEQRVTDASSMTFSMRYCMNQCMHFWRIKAVLNGVESNWSPAWYFTTEPLGTTTQPEPALLFKNRYETAIPISYQLVPRTNSSSRFELSDRADFSSILWEKEQTHNTVGQLGYQNRAFVMPPNLKPNTKYQFRIRLAHEHYTTLWTTGDFTTGPDQHRWTYFNAGNTPLPATGTLKFRMQPGNGMWVATSTGLYHTPDLKNWTTQNLKSTKGLMPGGITDVAVDPDNRLWVVGGRSFGWLDGSNWKLTMIDFPDGGQNRKIFFDRQGTGYLVGGYIIYQFDRNGTITRQFSNPSLPPDIVGSGLIAANNHLWTFYNSTDRGVGHFDGTNWTFSNSANSNLPPATFTSDIAVDNTGLQIWICGSFGVARRLENGRWDIIPLTTVAPSGEEQRLASLAFDQNNHLYVLGEKNLYRFDGTKWESFGNQFLTTGYYETKIAFDSDNRLLIQSPVYGLSIYDGRTFRPAPLTTNRYCAGDSVKVDFTANFTPKPGISYRAELSDAAGQVFAAAPATFKTGSATVALPATSPVGTTYKIRIVSDNPALYGDESASFSIAARPPATVTVEGAATVFAPEVVTLKANTGSGFSYQWLKDNSPIAGATAATLEAKTSGAYQVRVSNAEGCQTVSNAVQATIQAPLAVNNGSSDAELLVLPNPADEVCRIVLRQASRGTTELTIVDASGRPTIRTRLPAGQTQLDLPIRQLATGVYFLRAETKHKKWVGRLVKK